MAQAGAIGSPFLAVRGLYGSDFMTTRSDFKVIKNPYNPEEDVVVAPALNPDVFLVHGLVADREGNVITVDQRRDDFMAAQGARRVIATVEEVSEEPVTPATKPGWIFLPAFYVSAVVHTPMGSHPGSFKGLYEMDQAHMAEYIQAAQSDGGFKAYLDRYVYSVKDHQQYLERVGRIAAVPAGSR